MSKRLNRMLSAAILLPVLLFAVLGSSFALWRCQYDGVARSSCCCPDEGEAQGQTQATIQAQGCCDFERVEIEKAPSELVRVPTLAPPALLAVAPLLFAVTPVVAPRAPFLVFQQRPPSGRVLLLQKQAFLI
jgi:hypothetical protein